MVFHLFTVLFVGLKLAEIINWSWWLVLAPSYVPLVIAPFVILAGLGLLKFAK